MILFMINFLFIERFLLELARHINLLLYRNVRWSMVRSIFYGYELYWTISLYLVCRDLNTIAPLYWFDWWMMFNFLCMYFFFFFDGFTYRYFCLLLCYALWICYSWVGLDGLLRQPGLESSCSLELGPFRSFFCLWTGGYRQEEWLEWSVGLDHFVLGLSLEFQFFGLF